MTQVEPTTKKKPHYFEPTALQILVILCLFALALFASWEVPRLIIAA